MNERTERAGASERCRAELGANAVDRCVQVSVTFGRGYIEQIDLLCGGESARADAEQPYGSAGLLLQPLVEERRGRPRKLARMIGRRMHRALACVCFEILATDFHDDASGEPSLPAQALCGTVGEPCQLRVQPRVISQVDVEGLFRGDLLFVPIRHDGPIVDAGCTCLHASRKATEHRLQDGVRREPQVAQRLYADFLESRRGLVTDAEQAPHWQRIEERM